MASKTTDVAERREFPRIPFKANSLVIDPASAEIVAGPTTELSRFGCFVQAKKSLPKRSRVHVQIADGGDIFTASGVIAYVTIQGMGIAFGIVEAKNAEILEKWLSQKVRTV